MSFGSQGEIAYRAYAEAGYRLNMLSLNGDINFKGGEVYYFERNFIIKEGSLSLRETQLDFNPLKEKFQLSPSQARGRSNVRGFPSSATFWMSASMVLALASGLS